jgi:hypothetical protein
MRYFYCQIKVPSKVQMLYNHTDHGHELEVVGSKRDER